MTRECKERPCGGHYHEPAPSDRHRDDDHAWPWSADDDAMPASPHITQRLPPGGFTPSDPAQRIFDDETLKAEVAWDLAQLVIDIGGIFDPSPVSDGLNLLISLARGNWDDALISGASMVPYLGDAAKLGKLPGYLNTLRLAKKIAKVDSEWRKALETVFSKLKPLLDKIDEVGAKRLHPQMRRLLRDLRREVDEFLSLNQSGGTARQDYVSVTQGRQPQRTMGPLDEEPVEVASMPSALRGAGDGGGISSGDVVPNNKAEEIAKLSNSLEFRKRSLELALDPDRNQLLVREGIGAARFEQATGRTVLRSTDGATDFVDPKMGPFDLKGPLRANDGSPIDITPRRIEGLGKSVIKEANNSTASKAVVVDTLGLTKEQISALKEQVKRGLKTDKPIIYIE